VVDRRAPDVSGLYDFRLPELRSGHTRICVVGRDQGGNEGRDCIQVIVDAAAPCVPGDCCCGTACCDEAKACDCAGRLPNGERCELDQDCRGGLCEDAPWDEESGGFCTEGCAEDGECPPGSTCVGFGAPERGTCWSYVTAEGLGRPCGVASDCADPLACVFPDGCVEIEPEDGVGDGPCAGAGYCSRACDGPSDCPERFVCSIVGGSRTCRFAGADLDVRGGCALVPSARPDFAPAVVWLAALAVTRRRRRLRPPKSL
jgi:hypothetical protein